MQIKAVLNLSITGVTTDLKVLLNFFATAWIYKGFKGTHTVYLVSIVKPPQGSHVLLYVFS